MGNSTVEVQAFIDKYKIPYPIIPDPDFRVHGVLGSVKTPYSFYIRKEQETGSGFILDTHLGANLNYEGLFNKITAVLSEDLPPSAIGNSFDVQYSAESELGLSKEKVENKISSVFESLVGTEIELKEIPRHDSVYVYVGQYLDGDQKKRLFSVAESRTVPCDVCQDASFIYIFDSTGKIVQFEPVKLSKDGNLPWDEDDLSVIRSRMVGRYIYNPAKFDSEVDAVSSATITTQVILKSMW